MPIELIIVIALALIFDFLNGIHDSSNIVATMISSRAFRPQTALTLTALSHFLGPLSLGWLSRDVSDEVAKLAC
jgi:PiT family inorganic phosphate transporter